jgi:hypothetical protein
VLAVYLGSLINVPKKMAVGDAVLLTLPLGGKAER